jgi:low molecular weight protein-tyrosine phosphatase
VNAMTAVKGTTRKAITRGNNVARNVCDRALHSRRHTSVLRRLCVLRPPRRVLVVCHGNIIRSPYLEAVLQRALPDVAVTSAGFVGSDRPVPHLALTIAANRGLDLSRHRSRPLTQSAFAGTDLVIVMDSAQARQLTGFFPAVRGRIVIAGDLDPRFDVARAITDPWNRSGEVFESSFDRLDRCAVTLVGAIRRAKQRVSGTR